MAIAGVQPHAIGLLWHWAEDEAFESVVSAERKGECPAVRVWRRYPRAKCRSLTDTREIVGFLDGIGRKQGKPRLPACQHVGMISEDGQCMRGDRTRGNVPASQAA
jgi:hypothetical protein